MHRPSALDIRHRPAAQLPRPLSASRPATPRREPAGSDSLPDLLDGQLVARVQLDAGLTMRRDHLHRFTPSSFVAATSRFMDARPLCSDTGPAAGGAHECRQTITARDQRHPQDVEAEHRIPRRSQWPPSSDGVKEVGLSRRNSRDLTRTRFRAIHAFVPFLAGVRAAIVFLYAAGLVAPCLSSCLAPAAQAKSHECCPPRTDGAAFTAPEKDCCASEHQAKPAGTALHAPAPPALPVSWAAIADATFVSLQPTVRPVVSPPLILRI